MDRLKAPATPKAPRPTTFGEWIQRIKVAHPARPLCPPVEMRSVDDEFLNLVYDIDVCTERFMELQTTMTKDAALDEYEACRLVGMNAHMLSKLVDAATNIGLTVNQVELLQQRLPDLEFMENAMWKPLEKLNHIYMTYSSLNH